MTFELNRRHWNWWGSAEVFKFVLKKRTPESPLGRIENITIDGAQGTARGTVADRRPCRPPAAEHHDRRLRVKMLPENQPDKRATHAMYRRVEGLTLRDVEVLDWDDDSPGPAWGSALPFALRDIDRLGCRIPRPRPAAGTRVFPGYGRNESATLLSEQLSCAATFSPKERVYARWSWNRHESYRIQNAIPGARGPTTRLPGRPITEL